MDERIELLITRLEKIQTEDTFLNHLLDEAETMCCLPQSQQSKL